ncbi:hypothetical protein [Thiomicrorhabdus indica]|uniref:hypothetical protein n=1 Tax=Thiomicrorhabdus indica TaxID=2267253 RepID=UPI00102DD164|nr:hypothetical protein [Thiomicrorhabdus indica]
MRRMNKLWIYIDYSWFLPILAKLPFFMAVKLAKFRGAVYSFRKRDWRIFSKIDQDVHIRTDMASKWLSEKNNLSQQLLLSQRYQAQSIEELMTERLVNQAGQFSVKQESIPQQCIFITAHYGCSIQAAKWLADHQDAVLMTSDVVYKESVPKAVQAHYFRKYNAIPHQHSETGLKALVTQVKQKKSIIVLADLPSFDGNGTKVLTKFGEVVLASGAKKIAEIYNLPIVAYYADADLHGDISIHFSEPCFPSDDEDWYQPSYQWLTQQLIQQPQHWWAMDLLPLWNRQIFS